MQVEVELRDINDNNPQFNTPVLPYRVSISESIPVSAMVTSITANDADVTSVVVYSISDSNSGWWMCIKCYIIGHSLYIVFMINQTTGVVTLQQSLDRETVNE